MFSAGVASVAKALGFINPHITSPASTPAPTFPSKNIQSGLGIPGLPHLRKEGYQYPSKWFSNHSRRLLRPGMTLILTVISLLFGFI
jgi:hypothetical protein